MDDKLEALRSTDLFGGLGKRHLELIARVADRVELDAGTEFIRQGQTMTHMSIIIAGSATVTVDGTQVGTVGPGDVLGELSIIDEAPASATVTIAEPTSIWHIARAGFLPVWNRNRDDISTAMLLAVTNKLRHTNSARAEEL